MNTVENCKEAHWDHNHERVRSSGKEKKIVGIEEGLFWRRKEVLDAVCDVVLWAPCEAQDEGRGEVIVRGRWCYKEEGRKCTGFRDQRQDRTERKNKATERKRGINRNRKAEREGRRRRVVQG